MPGLDALAAALRDLPGVATTTASWRVALGDAHAIVAPCLVATRDLAQGWPCGAPFGRDLGCSRTIVEHGRNDIEAVCEDRRPNCATVQLTREQALRHRLDLARLGEVLAPALHAGPRAKGLSAVVSGTPAATVLLGEFAFDVRIAVALTRAVALPDLLSVGARVRDVAAAERALVLSPLEERHPDGVRDHLRRDGIDVLALTDVIELRDGRPRAVLHDYVQAHYRPGLDPWPWLGDRYDLVLDPAEHRAWVRGVALDFSAKKLAGRLLYALARHGGAWVERVALAEAVWGPDADPTPLPKRKHDLQAMLTAARCGVVIENIEASDEEDGAYRLPIEPSRISFWSAEQAVEAPEPAGRKTSGTPKPTSKVAKR